jgi:hyperosmotically inducible periplasmic protein
VRPKGFARIESGPYPHEPERLEPKYKEKKMTIRSSALTLAALLVAAPVLAQAPPAPAPSAGLDAKVQQKLVDKLGDDAKTIKAAIVENKVVLVGEVKRRDTQGLAEQVALSVPGVTKVDNQVKTPASKGVFTGGIGQESHDIKLEDKVETAVKKELGQHYKKLDILAVEGTVTLRGPVPDEARQKYAITAAKGVPGVTKVVDLLEVEKK